MQRIQITGYLSRDAETATTRDGTAVTRWNVPVKQGWGENEKTNWFRVSIWGKRAEFAAKAVKGEFATVTGELTIGEYEGKPQYEIRADDFQSVRTARREPDGSQGAPITSPDDIDDDIPFLRMGGHEL
jgi:single-strand DNA-binding protein